MFKLIIKIKQKIKDKKHNYSKNPRKLQQIHIYKNKNIYIKIKQIVFIVLKKELFFYTHLNSLICYIF